MYVIFDMKFTNKIQANIFIEKKKPLKLLDRVFAFLLSFLIYFNRGITKRTPTTGDYSFISPSNNTQIRFWYVLQFSNKHFLQRIRILGPSRQHCHIVKVLWKTIVAHLTPRKHPPLVIVSTTPLPNMEYSQRIFLPIRRIAFHSKYIVTLFILCLN